VEYPDNPVKQVSKLILAGWIVKFTLDVALFVACIIFAAKGIGWLLPLFAIVFVQSPFAWDKKLIRNAFALRHQVKAESFAAEVTYCKGLKYIGSDAGATYMLDGMLCFEGLYSRFRLDPKWVMHAGRNIAESSASVNLVDSSQTEWLALIINSIKEDGKGGTKPSDDIGRYMKPWLEEEISEEAVPMFPPTNPIASRWFDACRIADGLLLFITMLVVATLLLLAPRLGLFDKVLCGIIFALAFVFNGFMAFGALRFGTRLRKELRRFPDRSDSALLVQILKDESEFLKAQTGAQV